jgi:hypothetical protein
VKNGVDVIHSGEAWLIFDIVNCHIANPFPGCLRFGQKVLYDLQPYGAMEEEPETPIETVDHINKEERTATNKQSVIVEKIIEIFKGPISNNLISPANVKDLDSFTTGVAVEILRSGEWISRVITKKQKTKRAMEAKIIGPWINIWHKLHSSSIWRPAE